MVDVILWGGTAAFVLLIVWCVVTAVYSHYGRHDGSYGLPGSWVRGLGGLHRGVYVEKPEWREKPPCWEQREDGSIVYTGMLRFSGRAPAGNTFIGIVPDLGLSTLPPLMFEDIERINAEAAERAEQEQRIRDIVNDELASTPVYTALRFEDYGRFGDCDIDRADTAPLCVVVEVESSDDEWWLRGA